MCSVVCSVWCAVCTSKRLKEILRLPGESRKNAEYRSVPQSMLVVVLVTSPWGCPFVLLQSLFLFLLTYPHLWDPLGTAAGSRRSVPRASTWWEKDQSCEANRKLVKETNKQTREKTDRETDRQTDRQTDKQTDRQEDMEVFCWHKKVIAGNSKQEKKRKKKTDR